MFLFFFYFFIVFSQYVFKIITQICPSYVLPFFQQINQTTHLPKLKLEVALFAISFFVVFNSFKVSLDITFCFYPPAVVSALTISPLGCLQRPLIFQLSVFSPLFIHSPLFTHLISLSHRPLQLSPLLGVFSMANNHSHSKPKAYQERSSLFVQFHFMSLSLYFPLRLHLNQLVFIEIQFNSNFLRVEIDSQKQQ